MSSFQSFANIDIIERMMSADPDEEFHQICMCIRQGDVGKARRLYRCANVNQPLSIWDRRPLLHLAIQQENVDMVRFLLDECDANPNVTDDKGRTSLHMAVLQGNEEIIRVIVDHERIDLKAVDMWGQTALHLASLCSSASAARLLLEHCVECLQFRQRDGITPLQAATMAGNKQIAALFSAALDSSTEINKSYRHALSDLNDAHVAALPTPPSLHSPYIAADAILSESPKTECSDDFIAGSKIESGLPGDGQNDEGTLSSNAAPNCDSGTTVCDPVLPASISQENSQPINATPKAELSDDTTTDTEVISTMSDEAQNVDEESDTSVKAQNIDERSITSDEVQQVDDGSCTSNEALSSDSRTSTVCDPVVPALISPECSEPIIAPHLLSSTIACSVNGDCSKTTSCQLTMTTIETSCTSGEPALLDDTNEAPYSDLELSESLTPTACAPLDDINESELQPSVALTSTCCDSALRDITDEPQQPDFPPSDALTSQIPESPCVADESNIDSLPSKLQSPSPDQINPANADIDEPSSQLSTVLGIVVTGTLPSSFVEKSEASTSLPTVGTSVRPAYKEGSYINSPNSTVNESTVQGHSQSSFLTEPVLLASEKPVDVDSEQLEMLPQLPTKQSSTNDDAIVHYKLTSAAACFSHLPEPIGSESALLNGNQRERSRTSADKLTPMHDGCQKSTMFLLSRMLLKLIVTMGKACEITLAQKGTLKDLVVKQDPAILAAADLYDADRDLDEFKDTLIRLSLCLRTP